MREIRTYGSEGGGGREASPYPYRPARFQRSWRMGKLKERCLPGGRVVRILRTKQTGYPRQH